MILSTQSIQRRVAEDPGFIDPFSHYKQLWNGMSWGLSSAGYDFRFNHPDGPQMISPGKMILGVTMERFKIPNDLVAIIHDKSSWARKGIALQNTTAEPGWEGWLTLEISNHSNVAVWIKPGDPIGQIVYHRLDEATIRPYAGKYQHQPPVPVGSINEHS